MPLFLTEKDVEQLLTIDIALEAGKLLEDLPRLWKKADLTERRRIREVKNYQLFVVLPLEIHRNRHKQVLKPHKKNPPAAGFSPCQSILAAPFRKAHQIH